MPSVRKVIVASWCLAVVWSINPAAARIWPDTGPDYRRVAKHGIGEKQAEYLVALTARHESYRVWDHYSFIDRLTDDARGKVDPYPGFFSFAIGFFHSSRGSDEVTHSYPRAYWVSKVTGDVWGAGDSAPLRCYRISFPALRRIQREIMARTGASFASEAPRRLGIGCTGE